MADIMIRKRKRLRSKDVKAYSDEVERRLGMPTFTPEDAVDLAESSEFNVIFVNGEILAMVFKGMTFLTVRGILKYKPQRKFVTVDMGAVPYVRNGADIMGPGITDADPEIQAGEMVWIRDVKNLVPLAIGVSAVSGEELRKGGKGKAIQTVHYAGDKLWKTDER
ncbi:MAG: RNA-binding protein [Methanomassiliicoccaceae archaeon]|jgi:PUA domain protein|nr:RNA-binding protein [Methanomassiliicoccaceae archaeon]